MGIPDEVQGRVGEPKELDGLSDDDLKAVLKEYYDRYSPLKKHKLGSRKLVESEIGSSAKINWFCGIQMIFSNDREKAQKTGAR